MIKAAFFDIDGTLLSFNTHRVSEGTVRAFDLLHRCGVRTFLSTGRPKVLIPPMPVDFEGGITMNGALVRCEGEVLRRNPIPQADSEAWIDFAKRHSLSTMIFTEEGMFASQVNDVARRLRDQLEFLMPDEVPIDDLREHEAYQIIALMPVALDAEVGHLMPHCRLPRWHPAFSDIVCDGNSKAVGMDAVCRYLGISQSETLAFGDGANDIEMLQWAGIGVAMGNADDNVKAHADRVTTSVDDEGIEQAVRLLLANGEIAINN